MNDGSDLPPGVQVTGVRAGAGDHGADVEHHPARGERPPGQGHERPGGQHRRRAVEPLEEQHRQADDRERADQVEGNDPGVQVRQPGDAADDRLRRDAEEHRGRERLQGRGDEALAEATRLIAQHQALEATRERARHFAQRAIDALSIFPDGAARRAMTQAAQFAVARGY